MLQWKFLKSMIHKKWIKLDLIKMKAFGYIKLKFKKRTGEAVNDERSNSYVPHVNSAYHIGSLHK